MPKLLNINVQVLQTNYKLVSVVENYSRNPYIYRIEEKMNCFKCLSKCFRDLLQTEVASLLDVSLHVVE